MVMSYSSYKSEFVVIVVLDGLLSDWDTSAKGYGYFKISGSEWKSL